ncbi:hypothetical protein PQX77_012441 [Marasmius sp. AFHP31]|nr:hypothetical protein PQX77_012441 [Marasmius sp. AFHP31]
MHITVVSLAKVAITLALPTIASAFALAGRASDPTNYKNTTTSRGINYNYYFSPPANDDKRFLVLLHGWPGLSYDYRFQIDFFKEAGYGLIVPDMLGYGETDKPTDLEAYKSSLITRDVVDILDGESVGNDAVVIGHDWGSKIVTRLANYFPNRFAAFGFLALGNTSPGFFSTSYSELNNLTKVVLGYENFGYWDFFVQPDAHEVLGDHLESMFSLAYTADPVEVLVNWAPVGKLEDWVRNDRRSESNGTVITPEEKEVYLKAYSLPGAVEGSLAWYKVVVSGIEARDSKGIPPENAVVVKPVFFGAGVRDFAVLAPVMIRSTLDSSANATIRLYDATHWLQWEAKDEVNRDLLTWIEGLE